jgi:hypothetical protein
MPVAGITVDLDSLSVFISVVVALIGLSGVLWTLWVTETEPSASGGGSFALALWKRFWLTVRCRS